MKVAYYSPLPPERSGIADYSALLLPALRERVEVDVVRRGARRAPRGTDLALYHIGNQADWHGWIFDALKRERGLVVLHEFVLHHLVAGVTLGRGDRNGYLDAMQLEAGVVGRSLAHAVIDGLVPPLWEVSPTRFPLAGSVIRLAKGLVVHSRYVEEHAREAGYIGPIWHIPHPAWPEPGALPDPALPRGGSPLIGCLGNLSVEKRVPQLLAAFAQLKRGAPDAVLVLAGTVARPLDLDGLLARHGLRAGEDVLVLGYVEEERLTALMAACDVCVSLRSPTMGETSGSAIRALGLGKPLVVSDVGWFAELPDSVVAKVPPDEREVPVLAQALERLSADRGLRERMGYEAREFVRREHDLERAADRYLVAIEETAAGDGVRNEVFDEVARAAHDVGIDAFDPQLRDIAARAREAGLGY